MPVNDWFVVAMGMGTVFVGLICIVILCKILGVCCQILAKKDNQNQEASVAPVAASATVAKKAVPAVIPNRRETVAAIAAAIAEDLGEDISAIRIVSIEQI